MHGAYVPCCVVVCAFVTVEGCLLEVQASHWECDNGMDGKSEGSGVAAIKEE